MSALYRSVFIVLGVLFGCTVQTQSPSEQRALPKLDTTIPQELSTATFALG